MSHLTTVKTSIKCEDTLMAALDSLSQSRKFTYELIENGIEIYNGHTLFNSRTTIKNINGTIVFQGRDDFGLRDDILNAYTEAAINRQAQALGLSVHKIKTQNGYNFSLSQGNRSISVQGNGDNLQVEAHNFQGAECKQFTNALEGLLGNVQNVQHKPEYRMATRSRTSQRRLNHQR